MNNEIKVEQLVKDITGKVNKGQPVQVTKIEGNQAEVFYLEGPESESKFTWVPLSELKQNMNHGL